MVSDILVNIGLGNGMTPDWHQAISWTNADLLTIASFKVLWKLNRSADIFIEGYEFENTVCRHAEICFIPQFIAIEMTSWIH